MDGGMDGGMASRAAVGLCREGGARFSAAGGVAHKLPAPATARSRLAWAVSLWHFRRAAAAAAAAAAALQIGGGPRRPPPGQANRVHWPQVLAGWLAGCLPACLPVTSEPSEPSEPAGLANHPSPANPANQRARGPAAPIPRIGGAPVPLCPCAPVPPSTQRTVDCCRRPLCWPRPLPWPHVLAAGAGARAAPEGVPCVSGDRARHGSRAEAERRGGEFETGE